MQIPIWRITGLLCLTGSLLIAIAAAKGNGPASSTTSPPPVPQEWQRRFLQSEGPTETPRIHDPVIAKEGATYYIFSTGPGIKVHSSRDMKTWERQGRVFEKVPSWTGEKIPGSRDYFWAPDLSFFAGKWHLYYSVSTFGKNRSAIGLATNVTLDPKHPDFQWKDEGVIIETHPRDDWNAIDPNVILTSDGEAWLSIGSFWSGIKMIQLDPTTGKVAKDASLISIASRPNTPDIRGAIEAPFIVQHGDFFYLFVSFDRCCQGAESTYNVRVGRASKITGPYVDRDGKPMLKGGGTLVRAGEERWRGPGHNAIYRENGTDWLVYHAYDAEDRGMAKLRIEQLQWDAEGWPQPVRKQ